MKTHTASRPRLVLFVKRNHLNFKHFGHEKVSVLNGGLRLWLANNYELSTEAPKFSVNSQKKKKKRLETEILFSKLAYYRT
jgi:thiosulfate/3-mercaptopyruvate sulfurtransferase